MAVAENQMDEEARLRAKWSRPDAVEQAQKDQAQIPAYSKQQQVQLDKLASVKICVQCQAQGIIKRQYGHRVMDEVCAACDGEGCITTKPLTTAEKIAKVEALIANAQDLESLQRYEDALRSGELDTVL